MSSAKSSVLQLTLRAKSLIYSRKRSGPNILPRGTPEDTSIHSEETRKANDPECHNTATYKVSDDEKPGRRPLQNPERPRQLSHLSQENCTMSVAAKEVE